MSGDANHETRAFHVWNILKEKAASRSAITYGELAKAIAMHHRPLRFVLELVQAYCLQESLPPLTILVVNKNSGLPGHGFIAWDRQDLESGRVVTYECNWSAYQNPFSYAESGETAKSIAEELLSNPDGSEDVYARVRVRGAGQIILRESLLVAYSHRCAFCGFSVDCALESAHIKPWSECAPSEKLNIRNGLLLCPTHHRLFDQHVLGIDGNYNLVQLKGISLPSKYDGLMVSELLGKPIHLPDRFEHRPLTKYLEYHRSHA
jgi:putative restriction endonuclease